MWSIRRFGWCLALQPLIYGLVLLSRDEWAIAGASLGIAALTIFLSELLTVLLHPQPSIGSLSAEARAALSKMERSMQAPRTTAEKAVQRRNSESSVLQRIAGLLPGYSRLPAGCPLPLPTEHIDDLFQTELAACTSPSDSRPLGEARDDSPPPSPSRPNRTQGFFHDPTESIRGLIYPPELLAPVPLIWLPNDGHGAAEREAAELERTYGLVAIVDPHPSAPRASRPTPQIPVLLPENRGGLGTLFMRRKTRNTSEEQGRPADRPAPPVTDQTSPLLTP